MTLAAWTKMAVRRIQKWKNFADEGNECIYRAQKIEYSRRERSTVVKQLNGMKRDSGNWNKKEEEENGTEMKYRREMMRELKLNVGKEVRKESNKEKKGRK